VSDNQPRPSHTNQTVPPRGTARDIARRSKREVLLHLIATRGKKATPVSRSASSNARLHWQHIREANLVGIGFGAKETAGGFSGDAAVRVYVKRKLPRHKLSPRDQVPAMVNGIVTDVIAIGQPRFHARPVPFGMGISHERGLGGSLGCIVTKPNDPAWYVLSACHVLAPPGVGAQPDDAILEPAAGNQGAARIALLADLEPLKPEDESNAFDAAIAKLDSNADVTARIPGIGAPRLPVMQPVLYQSVRKHGAATLHTLGIVTDPVADVSFTLEGEPYRFDDVVQVTGCPGQFSEGGDSGALVVDAISSRPIGLIIGGTATRSYVSPLARVLKHFGAQLLQ
jgi:hypothetical protein